MNQRSKVKILTGWSDKGGSTTALIALTNQLNKQGVDTTMYGPHDWHLDKCKSGKLDNNLSIDESDVLICHFLQLKSRPKAKKVILACHEKDLFEVGKVYKYWDVVVFLNDRHREYHNTYTDAFEIIPNLKEPLIKRNKPELDKIAGVIGSIDKNKQTHKSIHRALSDGCDKVYIFGDPHGSFYESHIKPLCDENVVVMGFQSDKQAMYDSIGRVYHSSISEVACLVKDECESTGTAFYGNDATDTYIEPLSNDEIVNRWVYLINSDVIKKKPIIHVYFLCYNEENILPHTLRHYLGFCEKITVIDNKSTDRSVDIAKSFDNVDILEFSSNGTFHDGVHIDIKNHVWKHSIGVADYVIVCDADELLYHENIIEYLTESLHDNITIFKPIGYHMIADENLNIKPDDDIKKLITEGVRTEVLDKPMIFNCNKIKEINYGFGCHSAFPTGEVKYNKDTGLKMLHYKFMGLSDYLYKNKIRGERLSDFNKKNNFGIYYLMSEDEIINDYRNYQSKRKQVI